MPSPFPEVNHRKPTTDFQENGFNVFGKYDVAKGHPQWGWRTVFELIGHDRLKWREQALQSRSHDPFANVINRMLGTLKTSHTRYFPRTEPRHYQLMGVFRFAVPDSDTDRL